MKRARQAWGNRRAMAVQVGPQPGEGLDQRLGQDHPGQTQAGKDQLRGGAEVDRPALAIEAGQGCNGPMIVRKPAPVVVLDDPGVGRRLPRPGYPGGAGG